MKKLFSAFTFMLLFAALGQAQTEATADQPVNEGGPIISFEVTEIDYGVIEQNADPYRYFNFSNTGDEPLIISNAKGSCGCTVPKTPEAPVLPGESAQIEVRYDTKRLGRFTKTVTLTTNAVDSPHVLRIKGEVIAPAAEPEGVPASTGGFSN
ncbi:MAG: DUF1573 domain-containing protein [Saprospiraceae bacterium]|nr:DUF1573 domain-containing protein [Saprospiraceae bacterium]